MSGKRAANVGGAEAHGFTDAAWQLLTEGDREQISKGRVGDEDLERMRAEAEAEATRHAETLAQQEALTRFYSGQKPGMAGQPVGVPRGYEVVAIIPHDCDDNQARGIRFKLTEKGAKPDHTGEILVPGLPGAEVWLMTVEAAETAFRLKKLRNDKRVKRVAESAREGARKDLNGKPHGGMLAQQILQQQG
jgi:hypothetical protein